MVYIYSISPNAPNPSSAFGWDSVILPGLLIIGLRDISYTDRAAGYPWIQRQTRPLPSPTPSNHSGQDHLILAPQAGLSCSLPPIHLQKVSSPDKVPFAPTFLGRMERGCWQKARNTSHRNIICFTSPSFLSDYMFLGSKITADSDWNREIKRRLAPWKKSSDKPR